VSRTTWTRDAERFGDALLEVASQVCQNGLFAVEITIEGAAGNL
jgi:hypothetical protein